MITILLFNCWELIGSIPHHSLLASHLQKKIRQPDCSVPWCLWVSSNQAKSWSMYENPHLAVSSKHNKNNNPPLPLLKSFWTRLNTCPSILRKAHYINNKLIYTCLACLLCHQHWHPNQWIRWLEVGPVL